MVEKEDFAALLEESLKKAIPEEGDIVTGKVVLLTPEFAVVDFGYKLEGQVSLAEFRASEGEIQIQVGDKIEVYLERLDASEGLAILSREKAQAYKIWDLLEEAHQKDNIVEGTVVGKVKGGLSVDIGVKAFLPASQIDVRPPGNLERLIGKNFKFKILKLNKKKGNVIVSRRVLVEKNRDLARQEVLQNIQEGQDVTGTVKNLTDYGAFIDLGGIDGLLHITDMSWGRVGHPSEILKVGEEVAVKVLKIDVKGGKVSLGLKQQTSDPWEKIPEKYPIGSRVKGKIVNITDYGAFAELEPGIEGLIHVSEMSWSRKAKHPGKIVSQGDEVEAVVLDVDLEARRISLGMKQVRENPWNEVINACPVGSRVKGPVRSVTDFGVFLGLSPEVDGLIHVSDLAWVRYARPLGDVFKKGEEVEAIVLSVDRSGERISLGVKQITEDPWPRLREQYKIGSKHRGQIVWKGEGGVAVRLDESIEGLVGREALPNEGGEDLPLHVGDEVPVVIHSLDEREHKILVGLILPDQKGS